MKKSNGAISGESEVIGPLFAIFKILKIIVYKAICGYEVRFSCVDITAHSSSNIMEVKIFLKFRYISDQKKDENIFYITLPLTISFTFKSFKCNIRTPSLFFAAKTLKFL